MQAPRVTYTICEGSLEEKTEEDGAAEVTAAGHPAPARTSGDQPGHPALQQRPDIRHHPGNPARATEAPEERPSTGRTSGPCPDIRPPMNGRTSGPQPGHPAPACAQSRARGPCILSHLPLHVLDYIYSSTSTILGLANVIAHFRLELCSSMWFYSYE